jgi:hypothetical protein
MGRVTTIVLALACAVLSLLIIEQNRTIGSQRTLIRSLLRDSIELSALRASYSKSATHP